MTPAHGGSTQNLALIGQAFIFAIYIVQSLYFQHPKFQAQAIIDGLCRICVEPGQKPRNSLSCDAAQLLITIRQGLYRIYYNGDGEQQR